jgi:hypothetical protein
MKTDVRIGSSPQLGFSRSDKALLQYHYEKQYAESGCIASIPPVWIVLFAASAHSFIGCDVVLVCEDHACHH